MGLRFGVLGPLEVFDDGQPVQITRQKDRLLLSALLANANQVVSTDHLIEVLWGDSPPASGLKALQFHVSALRDILDPERIGTADTCLKTRSPGYVLEASPHDIDAHRFRRLVDDARTVASYDPVGARVWLNDALALWRGPALAGAAFIDFFKAEKYRLDEERLEAIELLHTIELALGEHAAAIPKLSSLAAEYPYREKVHALLITALYQSGRQADALQTYQDLRRRLGEELGIDPSPELVALESKVLLQSDSLLPGRVSTQGAGYRDNLPKQLTTFIGRHNELQDLSQLIEANRLVTVFGPGGAGKTRLAVEAASTRPNTPGRGVTFVDLASVTDPALVDQAVFAAIEASESASRSIRESLIDHLADQKMLIVLDNCEHLARAASSISGYILSNTTGVQILATSQQVLKLPGEMVYPLPRMNTASPSGDAADLSTDAARLFLDRAQRARPAYVPSASDALHIASIVHQLDGIPLAIELAAARVRMMTPADIADHLSDRLRLLTGGSSSIRRQETLEEALRWSYGLIQGREQDLFNRLAVFAGSFTHAAAGAVGDIDDPVEVFELLGRLVDKSLLSVDASGEEMRYRQLETLRIFGAARLDERHEAQGAAERHATHFLNFARHGNELLNGPDQRMWHGRFRQSLPDTRQALRWLLVERPDAALVVTIGLGSYWWREGANTEGMDWLQRALAETNSAPSRDRADALTWLATHLFFVGSIDEALRVGTEAVAMAREVGDAEVLAAALNRVGGPLWNQGRLREAITYFEEAVDTKVRSGRPAPAAVLWNIGISYLELADLDGAEKTAQRFRQEHTADCDLLLTPNADFLDCNIAIVRGDLEAARERAESALAAYTDLDRRADMADAHERLAEISDLDGDLDGVDRHLAKLGELRTDQGPEHQSRANLIRARRAIAVGDLSSAQANLRVALAAALDRQQPAITSSIFHETSRLAFESGDPVDAAALTGAVKRLADQPGVTLVEHIVEEARKLRIEIALSLGTKETEREVQRGATIKTSEALEIADRFLN